MIRLRSLILTSLASLLLAPAHADDLSSLRNENLQAISFYCVETRIHWDRHQDFVESAVKSEFAAVARDRGFPLVDCSDADGWIYAIIEVEPQGVAMRLEVVQMLPLANPLGGVLVAPTLWSASYLTTYPGTPSDSVIPDVVVGGTSGLFQALIHNWRDAK
ncbi:MAG: hypothetical protein U5K81_12845 [Trueperaceae bacterium]|nr:hypothetical protein [Trueperaceae bacterium]